MFRCDSFINIEKRGYFMKKQRMLSTLLSIAVLAGQLPALPAAAAEKTTLSLADFARQAQELSAADAEREMLGAVVYDRESGTLSQEGGAAKTTVGDLSVRGGRLMLKTGDTSGGNGIKSGSAFSLFTDAAEDNGYRYTETADGLVITDEFETARLIVKAAGAVPDTGAVRVTEGYNDLHILQYADREAALAAYEIYKSTAGVQWVQPSHRVTLDDPDAAVTDTETGVYNTWGADDIGIEDFIADYLSAEVLPEVTVAVVDTGINLTPALFAGRMAGDGVNFSNSGDDSAADDSGHGTHVSGTICELTPSNVKILPVKVFDTDGTATDEQIYAGLMYALEQDADILNMSFGGLGVSPLEVEAMEIADEHGIIACAAAGNNGDDAGYYYPGGIDSCITVGAVDAALEHASFSNTGDYVDVSAPGVSVLSYVHKGDKTEVKSGTSMATPHVAACCALLRTYDPEITPRRTEALLNLNAKDLGEEGFDALYGWGLVSMSDFQWDDGICHAPEFSEKSGSYHAPVTVELTVRTDGAAIYYTTDGSKPTPENGTLYTEPITVTESTVFFAAAYKDGCIPSVPSEGWYGLGNADLADALTVENGVVTRYRGIRAKYTVPDTVDGVQITKIADGAFAGNHFVEQVTLPDTVTEIGANAFSGCVSLTGITAKGAVSVGDRAFENCPLLVRAVLPEQLESLGKSAFAGCASLTEAAFTGITALPDSCFEGCASLTSLQMPEVRAVGAYAMRGCESAKEIACDWLHMTEIGTGAFSGCSTWRGNLRLNALEEIGSSIFEGCSALRRVSLPDSITALPERTFAGCSSLKLLQIKGVTKLAERSLAVKSYGDTISTDLPYEKLTAVGAYAFDGFLIGSGYDTVHFDALETVGENSFTGAYGAAADFPLLTAVPEKAFSGTNLRAVCVPNAETVASQSMTGCLAVLLTDAAKEIAADAFSEDVWVVVPEQIPALDAVEHYQLCDEPLLMTDPEQEIEAPLHYGTVLTVTAVGNGLHYQWFEGEGDEMTAIRGAEDACFYVSSGTPGTRVYTCIMTDAAGKTERAVFTVHIAAEQPEKTVLTPSDAAYISDASEQLLRVEVPADGAWTVESSGAVPADGILTDAAGQLLAEFSTDAKTGISSASAEMRSGEPCYVRVQGSWTGLYALRLTGQSDVKKTVSECAVSVTLPRQSVYGDAFTPDVTVISPDGAVLEAGADYEYRITAHNHFRTVCVFGTGAYEGYTEKTVSLYQRIPTDTPVPVSLDDATEDAVYVFVPQTDGTYYYTATVADGYAEEYAAFLRAGRYVGGSKYASIRTFLTVADSPDASGTVYEESSFSTMTGNYFSGKLDLHAGVPYYFICGAESAAEYMLLISTGRESISDAKLTGVFSGTYTGSGGAYSPEIKVTLGDRVLTEGVDYQQIDINSDVPGQATVMAVGMGRYIGSVSLNYTIPYLGGVQPDSHVDLDKTVTVTGLAGRVQQIRFTADAAPSATSLARYRVVNKRVSGVKYLYQLYKYNELSGTYALMSPMKGETNDYSLRNGEYCLAVYRQYADLAGRAEFTVLVPHSLTDAEMTAENVVYTGAETEVPLTVTASDGTVLVRDVDYKVVYSGTHTLFGENQFRVIATDRSFGSLSGSYEIMVDLPADAPELSVGEHSAPVTFENRLAVYRVTPDVDTEYMLGTEDAPDIVLRVFSPDAEMLEQAYGTGTQSLAFQVPAGETRYLMVKYNGTNRQGTIHFRLETAFRLLDRCEISTEPQVWTGEQIAPNVVFTDGDYTLREGIDYRLRYTADDVNIGTATANYIGIGAYYGICDVNYHIVAPDLFGIEDTEIQPVVLDLPYIQGGEWDSEYLVCKFTAGRASGFVISLYSIYCRLTVQRYDADGGFADSMFLNADGDMEFALEAGESCYFLFSATDISSWNQTFRFVIHETEEPVYRLYTDEEGGVTYRIIDSEHYAEVYQIDTKKDQIVLSPEADGVPVCFIPEGMFTFIPVTTVVFGYEGCIAARYADSGAFAYSEQGTPAAARAVPGDINGDGEVTAADTVLLHRILAEIQAAAPDETQLSQADVNGDGVLDLLDLRALAKLMP